MTYCTQDEKHCITCHTCVNKLWSCSHYQPAWPLGTRAQLATHRRLVSPTPQNTSKQPLVLFLGGWGAERATDEGLPSVFSHRKAEVPSSREVLGARRGAHGSHKRATCFVGPVPSLCISPFITCTSFLHGSFPRPLDPQTTSAAEASAFGTSQVEKNSSSFCGDAMKSKLKYGSTLLFCRAYTFSCRYSG